LSKNETNQQIDDFYRDKPFQYNKEAQQEITDLFLDNSGVVILDPVILTRVSLLTSFVLLTKIDFG
jgi:hypothetical protein